MQVSFFLHKNFNLNWPQIYHYFLKSLLIFELQHLEVNYKRPRETVREKSHMKKAKAGKNVVQWKSFFKKIWCIFLNWWLSATDWPLLKVMGPFDFITVHKLWLHEKLSVYNYESCITKYRRVVRLFIGAYII